MEAWIKAFVAIGLRCSKSLLIERLSDQIRDFDTIVFVQVRCDIKLFSCNESTCCTTSCRLELQCRQNFSEKKKGATRLEFHASRFQYSIFTAATQALSHCNKKQMSQKYVAYMSYYKIRPMRSSLRVGKYCLNSMNLWPTVIAFSIAVFSPTLYVASGGVTLLVVKSSENLQPC